MHGGRGVCQWCARSSLVETRQNPRPRITTTTTTTTTIITSIINIVTVNNSSNSNNKNNDIDNVGGSLSGDNGGIVDNSYKNPVTGSNNKNISSNGSRRVACAQQRRRRRRCYCYYCRRALPSAALSRRVGASRHSSRDAAAGHGWSRATVERK
ncbi:probable serine/threonine-protein kinase DDB_G0271682 [Pogonomyrmex barbatus]|uniref:Probable serine/threonine-protein kinase DDB_G0271682 n=1 Tax=Pogonomyrmex barbatus TaxID=144034 RepID=A0A6I9VYR1_9HYME|nr:probable serine/threonine-protein kinase DDB_G0271682 [Pogonomyrmex barbatus]